MRPSSIFDPTDTDGFRYLVQCVDKIELWWKPEMGGYQIKNSPDGEIKWVGDYDTIQMYMDGRLDWSEIG